MNTRLYAGDDVNKQKNYTCFFELANFNNTVTTMTDQAQNPIWECHICDKLFKTMGGKNKHIKTKHEGKRYTCALCNKSYTSKTNLEKHLTTAVCSCSQKQSTEGKPPPP